MPGMNPPMEKAKVSRRTVSYTIIYLRHNNTQIETVFCVACLGLEKLGEERNPAIIRIKLIIFR